METDTPHEKKLPEEFVESRKMFYILGAEFDRMAYWNMEDKRLHDIFSQYVSSFLFLLKRSMAHFDSNDRTEAMGIYHFLLTLPNREMNSSVIPQIITLHSKFALMLKNYQLDGDFPILLNM